MGLKCVKLWLSSALFDVYFCSLGDGSERIRSKSFARNASSDGRKKIE